MNLTIRQVRYMCEVARHGSIHAAARTLRISQSSVLAAIAAAEQGFGAKIFDRRPAVGVSVTPAGERFLQAARRLVAAEGEFARAIDVEAQRLPQRIRIGCFEPFGAMFMASLLRRYLDEVGPAEIVLLEGDHTQLGAWLAAGTVDFVVAYDIGPKLGGSSTPICFVPAHVMLAVGDPLAERAAVSLAEVAARPLVLLDLPQTGTYLMTLFDVLAVRPAVSLRTRSYETTRSAVAEGFGAAILNMRPMTAPDPPRILRRPLLDDLPPPRLQVTDIYGTQKPQFVQRFIAVMRRFFAEAGAARFAVTTPERMAGLMIDA